MITEVLQEEKVSELLAEMVKTVDRQLFLNISDYSVSKELKER